MTEYIPLARLHYLGGDHYGFALYQASSQTYADTRLPTGAWTATLKKPSTAPSASTSTTPPPGRPTPSRTNAGRH